MCPVFFILVYTILLNTSLWPTIGISKLSKSDKKEIDYYEEKEGLIFMRSPQTKTEVRKYIYKTHNKKKWHMSMRRFINKSAGWFQRQEVRLNKFLERTLIRENVFLIIRG